MYKKLKNNIKAHDSFGFSPSLGFNAKKKFNTIPGGIFSMFFSLFNLWLWYSSLELMFYYKD